jgi:hypothetical protein
MVEGLNESRRLMVDFPTRDFPEHGIHLIGPSNPSFAKLAARLVKSKEGTTAADLPPYSVFLNNTSGRSIVAYSIIWECVDKKGSTVDKSLSNIIFYVFLHGDEAERNKVMAGAEGIIGPNSTWFISLDLPARRVEGISEGQIEESIFVSQAQEISREFSKVTISLDGLFFDDGTFLGADTTGFFTEVKSQMDAQYEVLSEVESGLRSGAKVEEILRKLEQIAGPPMPELGVSPSRTEYMNFFRILFAKNVLGMKNVFGTDKAIEDVHQQLSKPWVHLRRL